MCFASSAVSSRLNATDPAPLIALYQHPSAKIQVNSLLRFQRFSSAFNPTARFSY